MRRVVAVGVVHDGGEVMGTFLENALKTSLKNGKPRRQTKGNASALLGASLQAKLRTAKKALELANGLIRNNNCHDVPNAQEFYRLYKEVMK
jgi:hypothetical protein